ncbi:MAG TPA: hypothetical protein VGS80_08955 [Ktedonobacterales bacterium]|nr:hypothetical protein [Ktedonobacterales bacterium]
MFTWLRRWHWILLHRVFGLPDRDHTPPHAPLSVVLRSHPPVLAHNRHLRQGRTPSFQTQLARERQHHPRLLVGWQRGIGTLFERQLSGRRAGTGKDVEP